MRALILSGGLGTRLRPLTNTIPKVMVDIGGKPLLYYHINLLKKYGILDIWINLHYLPDKIIDYFGDGKSFGVNIRYSLEKELLGTAGSLKNPESNIESYFTDTDFLVIYGDNLLNINYSKLIEFHHEKQAFVSIALYTHPEPWTKGVVEIDSNKRIQKFIEKPPKESNPSNLVNSGIYICNPKIMDYITPNFCDFGFDVFPKLLSKGLPLYGFDEPYLISDIGTPEALANARENYKEYV